MSFQIVSRLVNTSEQVEVDLAHGGGLDPAITLMDQKLWTRALEQLETMTPFAQPEDDAYRQYDIGVVNEALGYQSEDVTKARKYLQEAAIDYGKAIDAKPTEKNFLPPQTRIDTALAHYKTLGDRADCRPDCRHRSPSSRRRAHQCRRHLHGRRQTGRGQYYRYNSAFPRGSNSISVRTARSISPRAT